MLFLLAITILAFSVPGETVTNYCDSRLCKAGATNIGCNNAGAICTGGTAISFNSSLIQLSLDEHNKLRQKIASGGQAGFPAAARMATLVWDAELASLALLNVKQCIMKHDACRSTEKFHYAGQNLAISQSQGLAIAPLTTAVPQFIQSWYSEVVDTTTANIDSYPPSSPKVIGHFTQVVQEKATHLGCAAVYFTDAEGWDTTLFACNYGFTNMVNWPVYTKVTAANPNPAWQCTTGANPNYKALCSDKEVISLPKRF